MRIFFYANTDVYDKNRGVSKKVMSQIRALRDMGHEVFYTTYTENGIQVLNQEDKAIWEKECRVHKKLFHYLRRDFLIHNVCQYWKNLDADFDLCYLRFHFFDRKFRRMLRQMKKTSLVVIEAHGYPYREWKLSARSLFINVRDVIFEPFCRSQIDLVAAISNHDNIWGRKTVFIDNAVDVHSIKIHERTPQKNELNLISVAIEQAYHGFEKIILGLSQYYKNGGTRSITVYMVGEYREKTKKLVKDLQMGRHIVFTGKLHGTSLDEAYDKSDLAIGTFSKRANDEYGSSIKTKEFFAKGIPFINGWREYSFDDSCPYMKRFDMNVSHIDFHEVVRFYDGIKGDAGLKYKMRKFAEENFTWKKQFKRVFSEIGETE